MIPFFRKIRKKMADDNKPIKYLRYAIGEIALVVIGILIALQINNWNEDRKRQNEEVALLSDIRLNLETMLINFIKDTTDNSIDIRVYGKIESYIKNDLPYSNELDTAIGSLTFWNSPFINASAYNTLQSKGLDLIKNEALKNQIVKMYEYDAKRLTEDYEEGEKQLNSLIVDPFFAKHMRRLPKKSLVIAIPNDFENLKKNDEFANILSMVIRQRKRGIVIYGEVIVEMKSLIHEIEKEVALRNE